MPGGESVRRFNERSETLVTATSTETRPTGCPGHARYDEVDHDVVWEVVSGDLPKLVEALKGRIS